MQRGTKQALMVAIDAALSVVTMWFAFSLRYEMVFIPWTWAQLVPFAIAPFIAFLIFMRSGLYRAIFRYSGFGATAAIARAVSIYGLVFGIFVLLSSIKDVPRTVAIIQPLLYAWAVLAVRSFGGHMLTARSRRNAFRHPRERLVIVGAGVSGIQTFGALQANPEYQVIGFIDDDPRKVGRQILGVTVFDRDAIGTLVAERSVESVLLALPNVSRSTRNAILKWLQPLALRVRSIPSVHEIATGRVTLSDIRELDIEDLLGRNPTSDDFDRVVAGLRDRVVMVTGAGGSIGGELCRQILRTRPAKLLLVEASEYALYSIHSELVALCTRDDTEIEIVPLLANVRDLARLTEICATWLPACVYHAAAYKHVPLVEHNPAEGVANNVLGTLNAAQAAIISGVERFVLVSTDKAVRPTNVMGASKRLAEVALQALAAEQMVSFAADKPSIQNRTIFTMVRFGNVLGSSGSVVPLFKKQLAAGGPLTVTHPDVTRYFMTIPEAAQLVLQAGAMADGGEVFLLDMGEPVKIYDLARRIIELSGAALRDEANPDGDVAIEIVGLRSGEKLHEELLIGDKPTPTDHARIMRAREKMWPWATVHSRFGALGTALAANDVRTIRAILSEFVDGFTSAGEVVDLVHLERHSSTGPVPLVAHTV